MELREPLRLPLSRPREGALPARANGWAPGLCSPPRPRALRPLPLRLHPTGQQERVPSMALAALHDPWHLTQWKRPAGGPPAPSTPSRPPASVSLSADPGSWDAELTAGSHPPTSGRIVADFATAAEYTGNVHLKTQSHRVTRVEEAWPLWTDALPDSWARHPRGRGLRGLDSWGEFLPQPGSGGPRVLTGGKGIGSTGSM